MPGQYFVLRTSVKRCLTMSSHDSAGMVSIPLGACTTRLAPRTVAGSKTMMLKRVYFIVIDAWEFSAEIPDTTTTRPRKEGQYIHVTPGSSAEAQTA